MVHICHKRFCPILQRNTIYYHVTEKRRINSILRYGLRLRRTPTSIGSEGKVTYPPCIFISDTRSGADWLSREFEESLGRAGFIEPMVMLAVKIRKGTRLHFDPYSYGEGWYITIPIPVTDIKIIRWKFRR